MDLTFLGTGGGRFTMIKQLRSTGGMHLAHGDFSCIIDPGPGALVRMHEEGLDPEELDAVVVSHAHLDHDGDMNACIEAMTGGGKEDRGALYCASSVLDGATIPAKYAEGGGTYGDEVPASLDPYHRSLLPAVTRLEDGTATGLGPFTMTCIGTEHSDPAGVAFTLETEETRVGFVTDTELFDDLKAFFRGCDALVVNMMRPHDNDWKGHLTTDDAAVLVNAADPEIAIVQHFGASLIYNGIADQAEWLRERADADIVVAADGMTLDLSDARSGTLSSYL